MESFKTFLSAGLIVALALLLDMPHTYCKGLVKANGESIVAQKNHSLIVTSTVVIEVGDMLFVHEEEAANGRRRRNTIAIGSSRVWPNGVVPYEISSDFSGK